MNDKIEIIKGEEYLRTAQELSAVIEGLPLNHEQNERLINAILAHTSAGRKEAFAQGLGLAIAEDIPTARQVPPS